MYVIGPAPPADSKLLTPAGGQGPQQTTCWWPSVVTHVPPHTRRHKCVGDRVQPACLPACPSIVNVAILPPWPRVLTCSKRGTVESAIIIIITRALVHTHKHT